MPIHTYKCQKCEVLFDAYMTNSESRNGETPFCKQCGADACKRDGLDIPVVGRPRWRPGAIMSNGQRIEGHFGKVARNDPQKKARS